MPLAFWTIFPMDVGHKTETHLSISQITASINNLWRNCGIQIRFHPLQKKTLVPPNPQKGETLLIRSTLAYRMINIVELIIFKYISILFSLSLSLYIYIYISIYFGTIRFCRKLLLQIMCELFHRHIQLCYIRMSWDK